MKTLAELKFMFLSSADAKSIDQVISTDYDCITFREKIAFLKGMFDQTMIGNNPDWETYSDEEKYFAILDHILVSIHRDNTIVRKNLSIPSWLNTLAEERCINFSYVLRNALQKELGLR